MDRLADRAADLVGDCSADQKLKESARVRIPKSGIRIRDGGEVED